VAGTVLGAIASLGFARLLRHFVWGVSPEDPWTFLAVGAILLVVASIASFGPALRILRLDPAGALRE
jgi:ABC-type antimicrobial peptide transport system permease subunit